MYTVARATGFRFFWLLAAVAALAWLTRTHLQPPPRVYAQNATAYTNPAVCAGCHQQIAETYRRTGMGRSFYRPSPENIVEDYTKNNTFFHQPSASYFTMLRREGQFYQRRYQLDSAGNAVNVVEKRIDYILGSGNHSRAYVHRTAANKLIELPLAWYAEKGGYWGMNPGFDQPHHDGFRRALGYDCMFCHNGYPQLPAGQEQPFAEPVYPATLPEGIDCQRCHGPGRNHVETAQSGAPPQTIRQAILNPARLTSERQLEVCMQCHLETTSFPLPNSIQRPGRAPFSYNPAEPLSSFLLFFDHAPGSGRDDKFEIVNSAYRLRKSACYLQSKGKLTCTTCHNPHDAPKDTTAYTAACRQCHSTLPAKHTTSPACADCHMPKRRTEDVVRVVMTDHLIQRHKPAGDLLADIPERHETDATAYRGEVKLYYPATLPATPRNELDLALAQVIDKSNLTAGIAQLSTAIARHAPSRPEYYIELASALRNNGQIDKAIPYYREAIRRNPNLFIVHQKLGIALRRTGKAAEAVEPLQKAAALSPGVAATWHELGLAHRALGDTAAAVAALEKAIALDPDLSEAFNNLGIVRFTANDPTRAAAAFREAIRIQPDYADAHGNLANVLAAGSDLAQARSYFETSLRLRPDDALTRYNYARLLGRTREYEQAQRELEASLRSDPNLIDARLLLGDLLMAKGESRSAVPHYREAVRLQPESDRANLNLGVALAASGDIPSAVPYLKKAAAGADPAIRDTAAGLLRQLGQ